MDRGGKSRRQTKQRNRQKWPMGMDIDGEEEHMETEVAMLIQAGLKNIVKLN